MNDRQRADLALVIVSLLWGITFPLIRSALEDLAPHQFVAWRFLLATLAFAPLALLHPEARAGLRRVLVPGLLLGVLAWITYFSQTIGLRTVPAGRAAFITGTSVILTPLLSPLFRAGRPGRIDLVAAAVATLGLWLLTRGPAGVQDSGGLSAGDLWILLCAALYAVYIHALQKVLARRPHELSLAFLQIVGVFLCASLVMGVEGGVRIEFTPAVLWALGVCALLATVGTFWLQTRYQGRSTPERVALIFSLEPVFATFFAWWLLGETLSPVGAVGAMVILGAVLFAELMTLRSRRANDANSRTA